MNPGTFSITNYHGSAFVKAAIGGNLGSAVSALSMIPAVAVSESKDAARRPHLRLVRD